MTPEGGSPADPRAVARSALETLRDHSVCGHCRTDYETMIDALDKDGDFERLMREYVASEHTHPKAAALPERAREIGAARDEVLRRLGRAPAAPAPAPEPGTRDGVVRYRIGDAQGLVRSWREGISSARPRPLAFLRDRGRRGA